MQADDSALQQELQGLRCSTAQTEKQLQNDITSLQGQLGTALAASHQEISSLGGQLGTALADSAEVCPSPATLTFSDLAVNQLLCPSLKWCMVFVCDIVHSLHKALVCCQAAVGILGGTAASADAETAFSLPFSVPCAVLCSLSLAGFTTTLFQLLVCNLSWLDSGSRGGGVIATEAGRRRLD